jgi:hypothetical protein
MKREIALYPELSDERIDHALRAADQSVYRGHRALFLQLPGFAGLAAGIVLALWIFPPPLWDWTTGGWRSHAAISLVMMTPSMFGTWLAHRGISREMTLEFRRRLPEIDRLTAPQT